MRPPPSPASCSPPSLSRRQAPQTPIEDVREVIREELGEYPETLWRTFDPKAIASASLAQVHKAEGWNGEQLAVKVRGGGGGRGYSCLDHASRTRRTAVPTRSRDTYLQALRALYGALGGRVKKFPFEARGKRDGRWGVPLSRA